MLHLLGGTPEVTPIEGVACIPTGDCRQEISKPDYQLACQGIGRPGQGFQDKCQIATLVGIEPGSPVWESQVLTTTPAPPIQI